MNMRAILSMIVLSALAAFPGSTQFAGAQQPGAVADLQDATGEGYGSRDAQPDLTGWRRV